MADYSGSSVLVTGGGSGIGRAIALAFAGAGASVVVAGRTKATLDETVELAADAGGRATAVVADVTRAPDVDAMVAAAVAAHGRLDVAVNNAGIAAPGLTADLDEAEWDDVLAVNLTGVWLCMRAEIRHMRGHGGGAIVNIGSTLGARMSVPGMAAYGASKAGMVALTRTAAREYIADGVRVNAVSPGPIDTPTSRPPEDDEPAEPDDPLELRIDKEIMGAVALGRAGTVDEVAAAVLWIASPAASYLVGHDLVVDGGSTA